MRIAPALLLIAGLLPAQEFVVSPSGNDAEDGSRSKPFRTIQHAADLAQPGDAVTVLAGTYRETVRPPRSGTEGAPIVFRADAKAEATISGADPLTTWKRAADGRWEAPMAMDFFASSINQADQVFVDGRMVHEAQWPNVGDDLSHPRKATIDRFLSKKRDGNLTIVEFEDDELVSGRSGDLTGASIYMQPNATGWGWTLSGTVVKHAGNRITMQSRSDVGEDGKPGGYAVGSRYHVWGLPKLIDGDWEWVHDRARGVLVVRPPAGTDPNQHRISAKKRDLGIDLTDRSYITIEGLRLSGCSLTSDRDAGGDSVPYNPDGSPRYPWAAQGRVAAASHLVISGVHGEYLNHFTDVSGHFFLQWTHNTGLVIAGSDNRIERCTVRDTAGNGISLQGRRIACLGNSISGADYASVDCGGINTGVASLADDIEIAYNRVERSARCGIMLRGVKNSDPAAPLSRIHHNEVVDWGCQDWDVGAFYMAGQDGRFTRIDHNRFWCTEPRQGMVFGMYWDYSRNYIADHNLIWGVPTPIQVTRAFGDTKDGPSNLLICNNTAITNDAAWGRPLAADRGIGSVVRNNLFKIADFKQPDGNWGNHWPNYGDQCEVGGNLLYGERAGVYWNRERCLHAGDTVVADPLLTDPAKGDLRPRAESPAAQGAEPIAAFTRDDVRIEPPDQAGGFIGALAAEASAFASGPSALPPAASNAAPTR